MTDTEAPSPKRTGNPAQYDPGPTFGELRAINAYLLAALVNAFVAMGRAGANADTKHQLRSAWEDARSAIARAEGRQP
jgi:hypothetical protein